MRTVHNEFSDRAALLQSRLENPDRPHPSRQVSTHADANNSCEAHKDASGAHPLDAVSQTTFWSISELYRYISTFE